MTRRKKIWYAASVILVVRLAKGRQSSFPVWENVYLINAPDEESAKKRAEELGRAEQQDLELNGRHARLEFGGVRKLISCASDPASSNESTVVKLYDGVEASYSSFLVRGERALKALASGGRVSIVYEE